ncbi:MAG: CIA30 family protein, partial [Planctomycetota bacterium]
MSEYEITESESLYMSNARRFRSLLFLTAVICSPSFVRAEHEKNIVEIAVSSGSFKTLTAALKAADLVSALEGKGPFTVFAPTDEAFARISHDTIQELLKPKNKETLRAILMYHVVPGRVLAKDVVKVTAAKTLNGQRVDVNVAGGKVKIDYANVVKTDIRASNGVIHVIDKVIAPSMSDIVATAGQAGGFNTLASLLKTASLVETLQGKGPFTVFAPTDEAFAKLPQTLIQSLLQEENRKTLQSILTYHVVPGRIFSSDLSNGTRAKTVEGRSILVQLKDGGVQIDRANVVKADIDASNGVIHVIDTVLLPTMEMAKTKTARQGRRLIELAIERGVPLYNDGQTAACAAVYEIAAQSVLAICRNDFSAKSLAELNEAMSEIEGNDSMHSRSWALRRVLDVSYERLLTDPKETKAQVRAEQEPSMKTVFDFTSPATTGKWRSVNDGVMGGVSSGGYKVSEDRVEFTGVLSLKNRGGFASIRSTGTEYDLSDYDGVAIRVKGDGRTYSLNLYTDRSRWGGSYRTELPTKKGEWTTVNIPFSKFRATFHGRRLRNASAMNPAKIRSIGVTLSDKKAGPFRLEIDWVKAFGQPQAERKEVVR